MRNLIIFFCILAGSLLMMDIHIPRISVHGKINGLVKGIQKAQERKKGKETAKEYVERINGRKRENFMRRSYREAKMVYDTIGQSNRYQHTLKVSLAAGVTGAAIGLAVRNILLAVILAGGFYFLPLWLSQFSLYRYQQYISGELETALSLITTSYNRNDDILAAVEENLDAIHDPVKAVFVAFANRLKYVDANAPAQIEQMKRQLDNDLFHQWCDALILCQENHLLQATLQPIVNKFSTLKAQQEKNKTRMMLPLKYVNTMAAIVVLFCPGLRGLNLEWYNNLMHTLFGQIALSATAAAVFVSVNRAIRLSKPITYNV